MWRGRRRRLLVALFCLGVVQAVMALVLAASVSRVLESASTTTAGLDGVDVALLVGSVASMGLARWSEHVVGEDLGQDYVYEVRRKLIGSALAGDGTASLGVIVTRASNDLTAIRSWISQGIVPLVTAVPLIAVILTVLTVTAPVAGLAVGGPVVVLGLVFIPLSRVVFARARALRRRRGRMSSRIADTVRARESIAATGAVHRELAALDRDSSKVVNAAVSRAHATGMVRALALITASLATVGVVVAGGLQVLSPAQVVSCVTLVGVITTPLTDLGRVIEYRQNYKAARRVQAPLMAQAERVVAEEKRRARQWKATGLRWDLLGNGAVFVDGLTAHGQAVPGLAAERGEVVVVRADDPGRAREVLRLLVGTRHPVGSGRASTGGVTSTTGGPASSGAEEAAQPVVLVDGHDLTRAPDRVRRTLLGYASAHVPLEHGTVRRILGLRTPEATQDDLRRVMQRAGLRTALDGLPQGINTKLRNDGQPLTVAQRARVKLGRALLGDPPLLVIDGLAADLDDAGRATLAEVLREYPGVAVVLGAEDLGHVGVTRVWDLDAESEGAAGTVEADVEDQLRSTRELAGAGRAWRMTL
ncbi:MAG: ABC transporter ATP-binding protein [Micrococcus sp.]|nr:ABC transporter ATP-binding protein [Micrococcus sp.]